MKRKIIFVIVAFLLVLQAQAVFAADYDEEFDKALNKNNLRDIENLLSKRSKQINLERCLMVVIDSGVQAKNFNKANCLEVVKLLVRYGANVNNQYVVFYNGEAIRFPFPLENALKTKQPFSLVQFLLDSGADPNKYGSNYSFSHPLVVAYNNKDTAVLNLLLEHGANGEFLLPNLAFSGDNNFLKQLITKGVQIRSNEGAKALRYAAEQGKFDTVKLLVENGVNVNARDDKGVTALAVAYDKGEMEIYNYLKAHGAIDFEPKQATAQPAAPAPSSTTNVYVQPAPAQSNNQAQAKPVQNTPAAPQLNMGTYTDRSVTGSEINLFINTNRATHRIKDRTETSTGNISISGDQLVITWISGPLNGRRSVYHIDSTNQFSGSGETWKMGF